MSFYSECTKTITNPKITYIQKNRFIYDIIYIELRHRQKMISKYLTRQLYQLSNNYMSELT